MKILLLLAITASMPTFAQQNAYEVKTGKAAKLTAVKSSDSISFITERSYDTYLITISGDEGFSRQVESDTPVINIYDLNLPYNGAYSYEIKAVKFVGDIKDTINNGRSEESIGRASIVDVQSGKFVNVYDRLVTSRNINESIKNSLPTNKK